MSGARGSIERRRLLEKLPYRVEVPIPGSGLRGRHTEIMARLRANCRPDQHATTSRFERDARNYPVEILVIAFASEQTAMAMADALQLTYAGRVEAKPRRGKRAG